MEGVKIESQKMRSITLKLTLTFLAVSLVGVALVAAIIWGTTSVAFNQFLLDRGKSDFVTAVTAYYTQNSSWDGVDAALIQQGIVPSVLHTNNGGQTFPQASGQNNTPPMPFALVNQKGLVIVSAGPYHPGDTVSADIIAQGTPVTVNGIQVGTVLASGGPPNSDPSSQRYLAQTNQALLIAALGAAALALLLGIFLARTVTRPVRDLTAAARAMASGQLGQQVPVRSRDELGELTATFNRMSSDLERSNQIRRQMTADIAHDLRTPLAVITGYLEGLRDGVLKPTPQRYEVLFSEARHLQRLVEDLRTLSLADAGELKINRQPEAPADLLERLSQAFQQKADTQQVSLKLEIEPALPELEEDPGRIKQVLVNLVSNALRYTPPGGQIVLAGKRQDGGVLLEVSDNGAGITPEVLAHIFERFYRGDDARAQQGEETGLGLAIARSIVELHGGRIAAASPGIGQGTTLSIYLPV